MSDLAALRVKLSEEMPVTRHLGLTVVGRREGSLVLRAPLHANVNHRGTAFAGSLNALATLAGWSTVWLLLLRHGVTANVVIQDSTVRYDRPVRSDFEARCAEPDSETAAKLIAVVRRRGRGRINLTVTVHDEAGVAVRFGGRYVAMT